MGSFTSCFKLDSNMVIKVWNHIHSFEGVFCSGYLCVIFCVDIINLISSNFLNLCYFLFGFRKWIWVPAQRFIHCSWGKSILISVGKKFILVLFSSMKTSNIKLVARCWTWKLIIQYIFLIQVTSMILGQYGFSFFYLSCRRICLFSLL